MPNIAKRPLKFTQGLGYGVLTIGAGLTTLFLGTATVGLFMTGIGAPLGLLTAAGTAGTGYGTLFFGKKTGHKMIRTFEEAKHSYEGRCSYNRTTNLMATDAEIIPHHHKTTKAHHSNQDPTPAGSPVGNPIISPDPARSGVIGNIQPVIDESYAATQMSIK